MEHILKAIIVIGLLTLPWRYYFLPKIEEIKSEKQMAANLQGSLSRFSDGREVLFKSLLAIQQENIAKEKYRLEFMLPSFAKARANLMGPFDNIRAKIPGEWHVVPEGKFRVSGPLVFWPFRFVFIGSTNDAVRILAHMETASQFMFIRTFKLERHETNVELSGLIELVFHDVATAENGAREQKP